MSKREQKNSFYTKLNPKNIDYLGSEFQLNYTPNGRFQTKLGGFMWIGVMICMLAVAYSSFKSYISTDSPTTTVSNLYSKKAPKFDLYKEKIFFHFAFGNNAKVYPTKTHMEEINRFITVKGFIGIDTLNSESGKSEFVRHLNLDYKPCSQVKDKRVMEDFQWHEESQKIAENLCLCHELEGGQDKYYIQNKGQDPPHYRLVLLILPCSLPNPSDCASASEFKRAELYFTQTKKALDISNYTDPLTSIVEFEGVQFLEADRQNYLFYKMRDYEVWDDTRDFFDKRLRSRTAGYFLDYRAAQKRDPGQLHCDPAILEGDDLGACSPYLSILLDSSGEKRVTVRTYPKFFGVLGEIGGTAEILFIFVGLIYFKYNEYYLRKYIKSEVFKIESISGLRKIFPKGDAKTTKIEKELVKVKPHGGQPRTLGAILADPKIEVKGQKGKVDNHFSKEVDSHCRILNSYLNRKSHPNVEELIDQQIEKNMNGVCLCQSLNHLQILMKIFFKPRHQKLLSVVLLNLIDQENKNKHLHAQEGRTSEEPDVTEVIEPEEEKLTMEQAYDRIRLGQPKTEIEKIMDDFFLENTPDYFKPSPDTKKKASRGSGKPSFSFVDKKSSQKSLCDQKDSGGFSLQKGGAEDKIDLKDNLKNLLSRNRSIAIGLSFPELKFTQMRRNLIQKSHKHRGSNPNFRKRINHRRSQVFARNMRRDHTVRAGTQTVIQVPKND